MKNKIRELTDRSNGWGNEYRALKLTQFVRGWVNYFGMADMKSLLQKERSPMEVMEQARRRRQQNEIL